MLNFLVSVVLCPFNVLDHDILSRLGHIFFLAYAAELYEANIIMFAKQDDVILFYLLASTVLMPIC
jgi:hypothetical protein